MISMFRKLGQSISVETISWRRNMEELLYSTSSLVTFSHVRRKKESFSVHKAKAEKRRVV